ncbi:hypothetical protein GCM10027020_14100 [Nocardioides salsibiostraticola]
MKIPRPTLSGIIAVLALTIAVSGTAYAAVSLPKNSVGAQQIKTNAVRTSDIKANAVRRSDIKTNAVRSDKIKNGEVRLEDLDSAVASAIGDRAPTAYQVSNSSIQFVGAVRETFATMEIAEGGDYLITANLRVFPRVGNAGDNLYCDIVGGSGGNISIVNHGVDMPAGVAQVTMHGILSTISDATTLALECRAGMNEITLTYDWTAVQVDLN